MGEDAWLEDYWEDRLTGIGDTDPDEWEDDDEWED